MVFAQLLVLAEIAILSQIGTFVHAIENHKSLWSCWQTRPIVVSNHPWSVASLEIFKLGAQQVQGNIYGGT